MSGNTKREAPISWRPSPAAAVALTGLMERMPGMKRSEVLNLVVIAAAHQPRQTIPAEPIDIDKPSKIAAKQPYRHSGGIDREKNLAFQRQIGMDKAPKR